MGHATRRELWIFRQPAANLNRTTTDSAHLVARQRRRTLYAFQDCCHQLAILKVVSEAVPGITEQGGRVGLVPAALLHAWRETAQKTKPLMYGFRRNQRSRGHAMVAFDDREQGVFVDGDKYDGAKLDVLGDFNAE